MNRHQSNPFLSDWDDDLAAMQTQTNAHLFDAMAPLAAAAAGSGGVGEAATGNAQARRSSCGQAGLSSNSPGRPSLYRRNMSSFEAASLQLEQHQQQMLENGSSAIDTQKDLIAKMTADFQSAIQTNDKQFDDLSLNPFDPFETIVDDDGLNSPAPPNPADRLESRFELGPAAGGGGEATSATGQQQRGAHDSIDDDEEELVSTPVRNIKSSASGEQNRPGSGEQAERAGSNGTADETGGGGGGGGSHADEPDSITKASMFAALLASAESQQQAEGPLTPVLDDGLGPGDDQDVEATAHVIKGSPNSMGDGNDRSVSFFDPFETVIDKDALTSLVSDAHQNQPAEAPAAPPPNQLNEEGAPSLLAHQRVAESTSIETVIENQPSANTSSGAADEPPPARPAGDPDSRPACEELSGPDDSNADQPTTPAPESATGSSAHYDASTALGRPAGRRLEPLSGIQPPQPTPCKRPARGQRKRPSFQEDSSDSSEDDDRIQIVIRAREAAKSDEARRQPAVVPLLPPPPSKSSMKQARERGQVEDMPSPIMGYKSRQQRPEELSANEEEEEARQVGGESRTEPSTATTERSGPARRGHEADDELETEEGPDEPDEAGPDNDGGQFVIRMTHSDEDDDAGYGKCETPLYDDDTSYVLEEYPQKYEGPGWEMMLRYPPKKKLTANRFWKKMFVRLAQVPLAPAERSAKPAQPAAAAAAGGEPAPAATCWALQIFDSQEDKKPMQEIPIQATYTVSEISSQLFDQWGKIFTIKLQYIFYKERVGVRQGQLARFIHTGHIGSSTTSGGHGVDPISIGAIKRMGAPIEHSPQISQIIKLGCTNYEHMKQFKEALEDCLFRMAIQRDRALTTYKTEEVQMAVRDETYVEVSQIGTVTKQLARVRLFFLSFLNGSPVVEVGINDFHRQGREVVGRMDILPVVTEEWIRLEAWELHSTVDQPEFESPESRIIKLSPPDATFFELMRFRIRPPRNRELPLQISANMSVSRTRVSINCEVMVPGCVSRKHGQIPCENIAIRVHIPECWVYFFREEKHFRMGSKKSVNRRPGKVKGIERFLGGGGLQNDFGDESSLIEVTSGQAKYEHHHQAVVWRAARWPKESQSAYVQNTMKIRLPLTAYDKMPDTFREFVHVEYTMPATTVSHTTLRSISVNPYEEEPPEKYVKYAAKYEYKVKMRLSVNLGGRAGGAEAGPEVSPIVIMKQPDLQDDLQREADSDGDDDDDDDDQDNEGAKAGGDH